MLAHLLFAAAAAPDVAAAAADVIHVPVPWQTPAAVYGGITLAVALALWAVRQAFYVWGMRRDFLGFRDATIGSKETGAKGSIPELAAIVANLETEGKARALKIEQLERELRERVWCGAKHSADDRERRESVNGAYEAVRKLEGRLVDSEKDVLQLSADVKQTLTTLTEMRAMLLQLGHDVSAIALNRSTKDG